MNDLLYKYDGGLFPALLKEGNACQYVLPFAQKFCQGDGLDIGAGKWPLPGATPVDVQTGGDAMALPEGRHDYIFCARPNQRVITPQGRPEIGAIRTGNLVLGRSGFVRVLSVCRYPFRGRLYRLETSEGVAEVTGNHPVATPSGWLDADHLRHADRVFGVSAKIQPSHFIHCGNVLASECRRAPLGSDRCGSVPKRHASSTEVDSDVRLPLFRHQKWSHVLKEFGDRLLASGYENDVAQLFTPWPAFVGRGDRVVYAAGGQNFAAPRHQQHITIRNRYLGLQASSRTDANADAALAIDDPRQISPLCQFNIHRADSYEYDGDVVNLETEDGTFFLENILTHNSSHCLEHLINPVAALDHWKSRLRPGGCLFLYLPHPDMGYWRPTRNRKHLHEWMPGQVDRMVRDLGFVDVIRSERDLAWSFCVVGFAPGEPPAPPAPAPDEGFRALMERVYPYISSDPQLSRLYDHFGADVFRRSSAVEPEFDALIKRTSFGGRRCVEIGSFNGVTAAVLARHFEEVVSIDIFPHTMKHRVAEFLGLKNIRFVDVKDNAEKVSVIKGLDGFDAAYVDGDHQNDTESDFHLVRGCGRVLFHEYWEQQPRVWNLINRLRQEGGAVEVEGKFALWSKPR